MEEHSGFDEQLAELGLDIELASPNADPGESVCFCPEGDDLRPHGQAV